MTEEIPLTPEQIQELQDQGAKDNAVLSVIERMSAAEAWGQASEMSNQINSLAMVLTQPVGNILMPNIDPQKERVAQLSLCCQALASVVKMVLIAHYKDELDKARTKHDRKANGARR